MVPAYRDRNVRGGRAWRRAPLGVGHFRLLGVVCPAVLSLPPGSWAERGDANRLLVCAKGLFTKEGSLRDSAA